MLPTCSLYLTHTDHFANSPDFSASSFQISQFSSVTIVSDSLQLHGLQHTRLPCPSLTPRACSNLYPSSRWCHPTISSCVIPFCLQPFPASRCFSMVSSSHQGAKYWSFSFSISPSNEHPGLISFRMDWLDLFAVQGTLKESSPSPRFKSINSSAFSLLYDPTLTSIHDYWKNHSFDWTDLCWQSNVSAF